MGKTLTIRLPSQLEQWLDEESQATGFPKGRIVCESLEASRTRKARQRFLDLAGSIEGKPGLSQKRGFQR
jgi:predicted transcriptional regulator